MTREANTKVFYYNQIFSGFALDSKNILARLSGLALLYATITETQRPQQIT
ncbi:MAG: hypothetical protein RQ714_09070 [Nitrosomonas sp.]|nr:hypothetical protein [Nitrosomonas sp.]